MKEFKESLEQSFRKLVIMEQNWDMLDDHERQTVQQVAEETSFDELGNFEEVVDKFKQFYLQMQRTTVIDGYQCYITDTGTLGIYHGNMQTEMTKLSRVAWFINQEYVPKETMIKIISWYIDNV
jgi:hypothetical protein